jgi:4-diphosphocytidyl-2-C-methyl-D-erythritol kinase
VSDDWIRAVAPAKVNLYLHVTGRRPDGYHLLDSLAVFPAVGDVLRAAPAEGLSLTVSGPFGAGLADAADNLVLRAARALAATLPGRAVGARLELDKHLPVASGIGGGSADAAAALRLLARLWGVETAVPELAVPELAVPELAVPELAVPELAVPELAVPELALPELGLTLGADVPVCLASVPARMAGIGELLGPAPALPACGMVLVNPGVAVATPAVFRAREGDFSAPAVLPAGWDDAAAMAADLARLHNDLQPPAIGLCPVIADVLAALAAISGCLLARMSGSGATCFGLFADAAAAEAAARALARPGWWCWGGALGASRRDGSQA